MFRFTKEVVGLKKDLSKYDLRPVDICPPDYYTRSVEELFYSDFTVDDETFETAERWVNRAVRRIKVADPGGIMDEFGNRPTVRVSNHDSMKNPPVLALAYRELGCGDSRFAAMAELFDERRPMIAETVAKLGGYPVDRARMQERDFLALIRFKRITEYILNDLDESVTIFPEGGITDEAKKGYVGPINDGAMRTAKLNKVPLIVVSTSGCRSLWTPFGAKVGVLVSQVFEPHDLPDTAGLKEAMQIGIQRASQL